MDGCKRNWTTHYCTSCRVTRDMDLQVGVGELKCRVCGMVHPLKVNPVRSTDADAVEGVDHGSTH